MEIGAQNITKKANTIFGCDVHLFFTLILPLPVNALVVPF